MYQDAMRCKKCEDANDPAKLRAKIEKLRKVLNSTVEALEFAHHKSGVVQGLPDVSRAICDARAALTPNVI
jgi:hypothetical protein